VRVDRWIISGRADVSMVAVPFGIAFIALALLMGAGASEPLWAYLLCFVAFDVAHVWTTAYLTYLDPDAMARHRKLYLWPIPISFFGAFALHLYSPTWFWTALAYFAIYHFAKQQYGFIAIYKAKAGERSLFDYRLDKWTLWAGAFGPVLMWHATPKVQFDWFDGGEKFLFRLPELASSLVAAVMALFATVWLLRQVHRFVETREVNVGKTMWMVGSWISWFIGVRMADHILVSAAFLNFFHGFPFLLLVWHRCRVRWSKEERGPGAPWMVWLTKRAGWLWFYGIVFGLAVVEELLWDGAVWGTYLPSLTGLSKPQLGAIALSFWVSLLSLPQIVHYFLDAYIWKLNDSNPDLYEVFGFERRGG
jgi:hypothetical protein